jgi:hypothetical protein
MGKFFSSGSQLNKQLASNTAAANASGSVAGSASPNKSNVVSIVENRFMRMTQAHDRIRTALLASRGQNSR